MGGGLYLNSGPQQQNSTFLGATLERTLRGGTILGGEIYRQSASTPGGSGSTAANVGVILPIGDLHALLFSCGRAFQNTNRFSAYASYEFALGPRGTPEPPSPAPPGTSTPPTP